MLMVRNRWWVPYLYRDLWLSAYIAPSYETYTTITVDDKIHNACIQQVMLYYFVEQQSQRDWVVKSQFVRVVNTFG